ncbi:zinc ABC transporter ATP-binding protein [Candidatus Peregrinibacteria bacterium CG_4_10_14_0_2_um_filter_43_11]|nr:MAG: zinc ABC transporter ATP-binding protein [Candidatus Peregrinibacteria bacterium CG_4_10_14_0_2_um_filter_43_11]
MSLKNPLIHIKGASVELAGQMILQNVNMEIFPGEIVTLIGLNGSGKTTLLKTIAGIYPYKKGTVKINAKRIGYVPQRLLFDKTIPFSVEEFMHTYSPHAKCAEIQAKLKEVGALSLLRRRVGDLSGGELQRVLVANALLREPELLLLDEATAGLDVSGEKDFYELIETIQKKYNMTIIMVSHDIHMVFNKACRVFCLNEKTITCSGAPKIVWDDKEFITIFGAHFSHFHHKHDCTYSRGD